MIKPTESLCLLEKGGSGTVKYIPERPCEKAYSIKIIEAVIAGYGLARYSLDGESYCNSAVMRRQKCRKLRWYSGNNIALGKH